VLEFSKMWRSARWGVRRIGVRYVGPFCLPTREKHESIPDSHRDLLTSQRRALREYAMQVWGAWVPRASVVALIALLGIIASSVSEAREVVDMVGSHVNVPD